MRDPDTTGTLTEMSYKDKMRVSEYLFQEDAKLVNNVDHHKISLFFGEYHKLNKTEFLQAWELDKRLFLSDDFLQKSGMGHFCESSKVCRPPMYTVL